MFPQLVNRFRGAALAAAMGVTAVLSGCASAPAPTAQGEELSGVRVETGSDATQVVLLGVAGAQPTAVEEQDPARIVVDLPTGVSASAEGATPVWDGMLEEVTVTREGDDESHTRVVIGLAAAATWEMQTGPDGLVVRVAHGGDGMASNTPAAAADAPAADPWAASASEAASAQSAAPALAEAKRATKLTGVSTKVEGDGVVVDLKADGKIEGAHAFMLEKPPRLVVDLPEMKSAVTQTRFEVGHGIVKAVRVGQHDGKVRVVVDGADEAKSFAEKMAPQPGGLWLALAGAELPAMAEAMPVVADAAGATTEPAKMDEAAPADATAGAESAPAAPAEGTGKAQMVHGVQLDSSAGHDRVVIVTDAPADYALNQVDDKTVMVQVRGAHIEPEAAVRLTPEQPGVVSMVAAFEQPELKTPEVRVVVEVAPGAKPVVTQHGTMLMLEFVNPGGPAEPVPVMAAEGAAMQSGAEASAMPEASPESGASAKAIKQAKHGKQPGPAAIDPSGHGIEVLEEGGLLEGKVYTGRRISLDFKDVEIDDVLRLIAEVSDLNIIAGDEVSGQVTIRLVDVPWDQALDVILLTKGLGFVRVGNVLRIAPGEVLKSEEEARLQEKRAKEKLEDLVVKLQPVNYANVKEVAKMVKRLLTQRGTVDIDVRTNTVILKDIATVIDESVALIKAIDTQTPQVMIEAKIVEANLDYLREVGSRWGVGVQPFEDAFDTGSPLKEDVGSDGFKLQNVQDILGNTIAPNNIAVSNPITELATGVVNVGAFLLDDRFNLDLELEAAESEGEGKVISSPRVVTLDNRKASIEQGVSIPFQTFENGDAKLEFIDAVLRLDVTPHITQDRSIIMQIEVQRNAPDDSVPTPTGSPAIAKNEAKTETLVRDGQTLVIGGIYVVRSADRQTRVPFLYKIPIIGNAFKNNETREVRQELLVFVTPRVVVNPEAGS
jgi:type IV pilus assembly protein PilQ